MNPKAIRFTPEQRDEMRTEAIKVYADGATVAETAETVGCSVATVRNFLLESGVEPRPTKHHLIDLPEGMLTSPQAAALIGVGHASFNTMQNKGYGPPRAERPQGAHSNYAYYWRGDVEQWLKERGERRLERLRRAERNQELRAAPVAFKHTPDWTALLADVDVKRAAEGLSWDSVCRLSSVNPSQLSRLRNGHAGSSWGTFFRVLSWLEGGMPEPVRKYVAEVPDARRAAAGS